MTATGGPAMKDERIAVVTGASGGIGSRVSAGLAERGYVVVGLDRAGDGVVSCDVTDSDQVARAFAQVADRHGRIDVLVLSAGVSAIGGFGDHDLEVHRRVMEVTHFAAVACVQAALPALRIARGRVVLLGSVAGFAPVLGRPAYVAAKHAVTGLFEAIRPELRAQGVALTIVHPTFVRGGMTEVAPRRSGAVRPVTGPELTSDQVAEQVLLGIERGRDRVLVGRTARLAWVGSRHLPATYRRLMERQLGGVPGGES